MLPAVDYHIHTVYSGHADPGMLVRAIVEKAKDVGLEVIALTEHAFYREMGAAVLERVKQDLSMAESELPASVGLEIDPDYDHPGRLVFEDFDKKDVWPVLVSTHAYPVIRKGWCERLELSRQERDLIYRTWFQTMEKVVENPLVDVLAHPGRLLGRNGVVEEFSGPVLKDFQNLFVTARENNVQIELNENVIASFSTERLKTSYLDLLQLGKEAGLKFSLGSDAHSLERIGAYREAARIADRLGLITADFL